MVSVVIPVFNEEASLDRLCALLTAALDRCAGEWEIVFVDDGSTDRSREIMAALAARDARVRPIALRVNSGQSAALSAGFQRARGDVIITMDGDLQDDPEEIPSFLAAIADGYDLVIGWRRSRRDSLSKVLLSRGYNWLSRLITGMRLHDSNCGFKAYRRNVVAHLRLYGDRHRYIHVLVAARGHRICEIPVRHHPRPYGRSRYGVRRLLHGLLDLIAVVFLTRYGRRPLHFLGGIGALMILTGTGINLYLTALWTLGHSIGTRPLLLLGVLLILVGVQCVFFGLLAEFMLHLWPRADDLEIEAVGLSGAPPRPGQMADPPR